MLPPNPSILGGAPDYVTYVFSLAQEFKLNVVRFFAHGDNNGYQPPNPVPPGYALQTSPGFAEASPSAGLDQTAPNSCLPCSWPDSPTAVESTRER
jgi:hypothetical protein